MITLKQINYAIAVAETLHFKKAAEKCFVSPSTLSNAITEMESQLGINIFERDNKKVIVTNLGQSIIEKAKNIKNEIENINKLSELNSKLFSNSISLGIIPTIGPFLLPVLLPRIKKDFPNLNLNIFEAQTDVLLKKISSGEIEMAIMALPFQTSGYRVNKFWNENFFWITKKEDPRAVGTSIKAKDLDLSELIMLEEGNCLKDHILNACKIKNTSKITFNASTLSTSIELVKGGIGTTLVPEMAVTKLITDNPELSKLKLDEKGPHREIALISRKNYAGDREIKHLVKLFSEELRNHKNIQIN
ncbi:MAG: LysR substrate-binding domain-containing protein [Gammaproteobacteria bacterium]|nr:MAG: hydrogen peroxide-inducible genes activator [Gammaproteobacteria bacterium]|tara:strand:- start:1917 stop:2828 length:912 start_codon:yes stop_codon:yes gene_type:complete